MAAVTTKTRRSTGPAPAPKTLYLAEALPPRFPVGARVRVDDRAATGHCRTPLYVRGKVGTVTEHLGAMRDPEKLAYHKPGFPGHQHYKVRFPMADLWPAYAGRPGDHLEVDLADNWLEPA